MDREWVQRAVNTAGKPCPLRLADPCPGDSKKCAFWLQLILTNGVGETSLMEGCAYIWQIPMLHESVVESRRAQKAANESANLFARAATAVFKSANDRVLEIAEAAEQRLALKPGV